MSRCLVFAGNAAFCFFLLVLGCSNGSHENADAGDTDTWPQAVDPRIEWVEIDAGSFTFGAPIGTPCMGELHEKEVPVTLTRPFEISKTEITQKQWAAMGFQVPPIDPVCDDCPVQFINWYEALAWCNALSRFEGLEECYDLSSCTGGIGNQCWGQDSDCSGNEPVFQCSGKTRKYDSMYDCTGYRLPTGPEWEYAAKAGTTTNTYNGDITVDSNGLCIDEPILDDIAWYCFNSGCGDNCGTIEPSAYLKEVALKQPNPWGLNDMLGNAGEWVDYVGTGFSLDSNEGKPGEALSDPMGAGETDDSRGDVRGGWFFDNHCYIRAAHQFADSRENRQPGFGFRPVRTLPAGSTDAGMK